jgi:hypothetical protein
LATVLLQKICAIEREMPLLKSFNDFYKFPREQINYYKLYLPLGTLCSSHHLPHTHVYISKFHAFANAILFYVIPTSSFSKLFWPLSEIASLSCLNSVVIIHYGSLLLACFVASYVLVLFPIKTYISQGKILIKFLLLFSAEANKVSCTWVRSS